MSGYSLDANILIDALLGHLPAHDEMRRIAGSGARMWISRMAWIEALSKGDEGLVGEAGRFLARFGMDELDEPVATRAAALRRQTPRLRSPDAIILASAQVHGRTLVTRNTKNFPATMPGVRVPYIL